MIFSLYQPPTNQTRTYGAFWLAVNVTRRVNTAFLELKRAEKAIFSRCSSDFFTFFQNGPKMTTKKNGHSHFFKEFIQKRAVFGTFLNVNNGACQHVSSHVNTPDRRSRSRMSDFETFLATKYQFLDNKMEDSEYMKITTQTEQLLKISKIWRIGYMCWF